jgi:phosphopantothenate-cysteine ligase
VTRYGVHAVVANLLHTRKDRVMVVHGGGSGDGGSSSSSGGADGGGNGDAASQARPAGAPAGLTVVDVRRPAAEPHIERLLVTKVVQLHSSFRAQHAERVS